MEIIFRADGDSVKGLGHVMRSSSLMQMVGNDFSCRFLTGNVDHFPFDDYTSKPRVEQIDASSGNEAEQLAGATTSPGIFVLDGYNFDTAYQQVLKNAGHYVVCIDDIMQYHFIADVVINHAGGVSPSDYSAESYTQFCLGPEFCLVRPIFYGARPEHQLEQKTILVNLGGADPENQTEQVLDSTFVTQFETVHLVVGSANLHFSKLREKYANSATVKIHHGINAEKMASLMGESPYAVLSPSTVCYEYMASGGVVFLHQIAENQQRIYQYFIKEKMAFDLQDMGRVSADDMRSSVKKQKEVFDGKSAGRFLDVFAGIQKVVNA